MSCSFQMIPVFMCWSVVVAVCHLHSSNISCTQNFWIEGLNQTQQSQHHQSKTKVPVHKKKQQVTCLSTCPSLKVHTPLIVPHSLTVPLSLQYNLECATLKAQNYQSLSECNMFYQQLILKVYENFKVLEKW